MLDGSIINFDAHDDATPDLVLARTFNEQSRGRPGRIFAGSALIGPALTLRNTPVTVGEVLNALDTYNERYALAQFPELTTKDIERCRAIAAHHLSGRKEFTRNGAASDVKAMFDENAPWKLIGKMLNDDIRLEHASFHQLSSRPDQTIWRYLIANGFKLFLTGDDDFLKIAEICVLEYLQETGSFDSNIAHLPLPVHISLGIRDPRLMESACRKNLAVMAEASRDSMRAYVSMTMTKDGLLQGPSASQVYHKYVRSSISGITLDSPIFDTRVMDHNGINLLRGKFGFSPLKFTSLPEWKDFYDLHYTRKKSRPAADHFVAV